MLVFKIAAIENKKYGYVSGDFVPKLKTLNSLEEQSGKSTNEFDYLFDKKEKLFFYENEKYNDIKSHLNGDYLGTTYVFNKFNMTLTDTPSKPFITDNRDGIFRFKCQVWKKQKWYEFP